MEAQFIQNTYSKCRSYHELMKPDVRISIKEFLPAGARAAGAVCFSAGGFPIDAPRPRNKLSRMAADEPQSLRPFSALTNQEM